MSFTLQIFHAPAVRTIAQALAFFDNPPPAAAANRARFNAFRDDILRVYPDNSEADDDEVDNAWPEGWSHDLGEDAVLVFMVATDYVDENLMRHLAHAAARAGLHLMDEQSACLYRTDGTSIDMQGREQPVGKPVPPRPKQRLPKDLTAEALGSHLTAAFIARHPEAGFVPRQSRYFAEMERSIGGVTQRIRFAVSLRTEEAMIGTSMEFFCPALAGVWERLLAEHVAAHAQTQRANPGRRPELSLTLHDFDEPPGKNVDWWRVSNYAHVHSLAEADAFIAGFSDWYTKTGAAALARLVTSAGLARLALSDFQMQLMLSANNLSAEEMFARLVLIGAFDLKRKEEWMAALRDHRKRQGKPGGADSIVPDRDTALEKLFGLLGGAAFAAEAARLGPPQEAGAPAPPARQITLQVWEHPAGRYWPRDWAAAMHWLTRMRAAPPGPQAPHAELLRLLAAPHPGSAAGQTQGAVHAISVPENARAAALDTARALALSVADEAGGEVHYANGFVVTKEHSYRHRLPEYLFDDPQLPGYRLKPGGDLLPLQGMLDLACLRLEKFFKRHGFVRQPDEPKPEPAPDAPPPRLAERSYRRPQGAGWSELQINVATRGEVFSLFVDCAACLSEAARLNKQFFVAGGGKDDGVEHATAFTRQHFWMTDPQDLLGTDSGLYFITRMDDLDTVLAHFTAQAEARLLPHLSAFDSAAGVDALLNGGPEPSSIFFEGNYEFAEQHLIAARAARSPRFEALCEMVIARATAYRAGKRRSIFGDTVQKLKDLAAFLKAN
ncbi:MAG TPA: hypothetical protein VGN52_00345 [Burkholderiales bacterium]